MSKRRDAGFSAIALEGFELAARVGVEDRQVAILGRDGVVHDGEGQVGPAHFAAGGFQAGERLRRSDFMDQVAVDVDQRGFAGDFSNEVGIPDFFVECLWRP